MTETKQAAGGRTVHLALVQFESVLCDPAANTQKACRMIAEAAAEGADLVVLPELFSTGYELNIVGPHVPELAEPVDGPTVRALQDAARAGNCYVVAGLALAYDMAGVPFNSSVVIDRQGELLGTYDKQHLWALERFYFRSGCDCPVFDTDFGRIGVMICYDMGFPEVARMLGNGGYGFLSDFQPILDGQGDCYARVKVRALEVLQSIDIIEEMIAKIPAGDIAVDVKGSPAAGAEAANVVEQPRGECYYYARGNGSKFLDRMRMRTPTSQNLAGMATALAGCDLADVNMIVLTIDPCISCTER